MKCTHWRLALVVSWIFLMSSGARCAEKIKLSEHKDWYRIISHLIQIKQDVTVVESKVVGTNIFEMTKSFLGDLKPGQKLLFSDCNQILIAGSTENYLRSLVRAPVVDRPVKNGDILELSDGEPLNGFSPPGNDASFILLLWQIKKPHWGFVRQTHGDFFLVHSEKVFRLARSTMGKAYTAFWVPLAPETKYSEFIKLLEQEIRKRKSEAHPQASKIKKLEQ